MKRILVVGAGAMGGLYASYLAKVADVTVLDSNQTHVDAIRRKGLELTGRTTSVTRLTAFAHAAEMGPRRFDAAIILVKSQSTEAALHSIHPVLEGSPVLATFPNCICNEERLMRLASLHVAPGVSRHSA